MKIRDELKNSASLRAPKDDSTKGGLHYISTTAEAK